ncbi:MAG: DUF1727 domain-containing protein [Acidimicrobiales bacterium]
MPSRSASELPLLPLRTRVAVGVGAATSALSRRLGRGAGSIIGGRAVVAVDPHALEHLTAGRTVVLVSGTNGKTTTTKLLAAAASTAGPVVANLEGANLLPALAGALAGADPAATAVLEVDEAWLPKGMDAVGPAVVVLLNLSRDQLDRNNEVRRLAGGWRTALARHPDARVVANCDDPIVAWAAGPPSPVPAAASPAGAAPAGAAPARVTWVAAGQPWVSDATGCPSCGSRLLFSGEKGWACTNCDLRRPEPDVWLEGDDLVTGGERRTLQLSLPGRANRADAAMALTAAELLGARSESALNAVRAVADVGGRYRVVSLEGVTFRMLLAKNPAGWLEVLDMLEPPPRPVVVAINARIADGKDPSWLWDVPFESLRGRTVVAAGERASDLAVRLRYADVNHRREPDMLAAIAAAGSDQVEFVGNYTAFQDLRRALERR